jgi:hypothetical protein
VEELHIDEMKCRNGKWHLEPSEGALLLAAESSYTQEKVTPIAANWRTRLLPNFGT